MCGRFYLDVADDKLVDYFDLPAIPGLAPRYNIAPSRDLSAVRVGEQGREWVSFHRGLIPFWAKDEKIDYRTINARAETVDTKPSFIAAFKYCRCLIPASGLFEWKTEKTGNQPYCIHPEFSPLFAFARLYEYWEGKAGRIIDFCTILVTDAKLNMFCHGIGYNYLYQQSLSANGALGSEASRLCSAAGLSVAMTRS